MYAAPIYAHDEVVGAINIGYGNPPTDNQTLSKLAEEYDTDIELLRQAALAFKPRPAFIVEAAKARVQIAAKQIGQMVEIHRAHAEIQKNKTLLDATARMAKVGGWELDVKTNEVKWTKETYRIHELPMDSKPLLEEAISFYHPEDRPILEQALREALNAGEPFDLQLRFTTVKGRDLVTRAICTPVLENGKVVHLQGTFQDITEQRRAEEALRESRETLRTTFKSIGDAVISTNTKAHVVSMNPVAESLTGWSEKDALGQPLETIFPIINERTRKPVESPVTKTLKRGCIVGLANHSLLLAKDGLETPIADSSAPIFNDTGEITGVVLVFRDQTEERAARKALESNLELLQIAGETAGFGGWVVDLEKDICILSDVVADIHDVPRGHTLSVQEGINFYAPEWLEKITEVFSACAEKGTPYDVELEIITKKGNRVWVRTCGRAVRNESGKIIKVQGSFQDITEQVETQIRFQMLFENMNTCVAIYRPRTDNSDFEFVDMNPIGLKYSRISREDIIGRNVTEVFPGVKKSGVFEVLQRVAETGKPEDIPATHYKDNRIELWVENHVFKLPSGLIVAVYEDITEQKKMQERVNHSEKMDAIGHLAGGIAHDFNNQLTGVLGFADMLVQQLDDPDLRQYAENIFAAAQRSKDLTMKLLAFSRKGQFQSVPIDTHKVINETIEILLHTIDKRIHIKQEFNADETTITGDPSSIQNALLNICVNARDAMPEGGTLAITTQVVEIDEPFRLSKGLDVEDGHYIEISVKDTGSGIPEDVMPHVFEPFYTTKSEGRGTGMGLSAVYGTVNKHGGDITLQSKVGEGTCFEIYLPLSSSDIEESSEDKNVEKENVSESLRILVVDDEDFVRNFECELLSTFGHSVLCAGNGKEAVELYRDEWPNIDLVILDMIMPKMGGKDAFREMKTINPEIKVILASGYSIDHEAQSILDEGAVGFVQKPFTVAQLLSEINLALS